MKEERGKGKKEITKSFRMQVADWLAVSQAARMIEWTNALLSLLSVIAYIVQDLVNEGDAILSSVQEYINLFFAADFLLHLYAAESRYRFLINQYVLVDIVTIVPTLMTFFVKRIGNGEAAFLVILQAFNFLRVVRLVKLQRLLTRDKDGGRDYGGPNVRKELFAALLNFFVVIFSFAGAFLVIENLFASESMKARKNRSRLTIIDCVYFVATTVSTVGYGDVAPISIPGKFFVMFMIVISLAFISDKLNQIVTLINSQSTYARATFEPPPMGRHVVVCGSFDSSSMAEFLGEFFHPDHGSRDKMCHVVIIGQGDDLVRLGQGKPDLTMKSLLEDESFFTHTKYLEGFVMRDKDLFRAKVERAECVFILCNKDSSKAKDVDAATVFRAMSIKKYVRMKANKDIFIIMQLIQSRSKIHFHHSCYGHTNFQIVCMDEIKQGLLAKSCLCPGFSTLVSNLITSSNIVAQESMETWMFEYVQGCGKEVYRVKLSRVFEGKAFGQVCNIVYAKYNCTLFAIEIVDRQGKVRVVMSPTSYEIPSGSAFGYIIADDADMVEEVSRHGWVEQRDQELARNDDSEHGEPFGISAWVRSTSGAAEVEDFMSSQAATDKMRRLYHYLEEPRPYEDAVRDQVESMYGHILLLGEASSNVFFVETLRRKHVMRKNIVILCPEKPSHETWNRVRHFPGVYFIVGSQKSRKDLVRAGVHGIDTAVIISSESQSDQSSNIRIPEIKGGDRLLDADCIFAYQTIRRHCSAAKIICQLRRAANIMFLTVELGRDFDVMVAPPFASGIVFLSAMLDRLTVQSFYNRDLLSILQALVSSSSFGPEDFTADVATSELCSQPVPRSFEGKTYMQLFQYLISKRATLPLGLYRNCPMDDVSPQPYVITNPPPDLLLNAQDTIFALLSPESMSKMPLGDIVVAVVEAEIPQRTFDRGGLGPYVPRSVSCVIESEGETAQTDTCVNVLWPHWNFACRFSIIEAHGTVEVTVVDGDKATADNFLGKVLVSLDAVIGESGPEKVANDSWYPLTGRHADGLQARGQLRLQLCFMPSPKIDEDGVEPMPAPASATLLPLDGGKADTAAGGGGGGGGGGGDGPASLARGRLRSLRPASVGRRGGEGHADAAGEISMRPPTVRAL